MVLTGVDMALEAAALTVAHCTDGSITSVRVSMGAVNAPASAACVRAAEAVAVRLGVDVSIEACAGSVVARFSAISAARPEHPSVRRLSAVG